MGNHILWKGYFNSTIPSIYNAVFMDLHTINLWIFLCLKVYFRKGISISCPEGEEWIAVDCDDLNFVQISVSSTGIMCGCTWDGKLAIRDGVDHTNVTGIQFPIVFSSITCLARF